MKKKTEKYIHTLLLSFLLLLTMAPLSATAMTPLPAYAAEDTADEGAALEAESEAESAEAESTEKTTSAKAYAAGILLAVVATAGAIAMAYAISKAVNSIARQPEAGGAIRTTLMLGLVFIETAIIYALIIAILIIFVL